MYNTIYLFSIKHITMFIAYKNVIRIYNEVLELLAFSRVKVFRIIPEFRILSLTFYEKSASKY